MTDERTKQAARLKEAREYVGLSQLEVSEALGISRSAISLIESGQRKVDSVELKGLARLYKRPVTYFTGEHAVTSPFVGEVEVLARRAAKLSQSDQDELLRFSEFLEHRAKLKDPR